MALKPAMRKSWKWVVALGGGLAVIAGIVLSLNSIRKGSAELVGPIFQKDAEVAIGLGTPADRYVTVALNFDPATRKFVAVKKLVGGNEMAFELPANAQHRVQWQGLNFKPAAADIIVGEEPSKWTLKISGREGELDVLALVEAVSLKQAAGTPVSATSLVAAASVSPGWDNASAGTLGPAMNRAYSIIGLLEVGSADCANSLLINRITIVYGCVGFYPGNLAQVLARAEAARPGLVDQIMGPRAAALRAAEHNRYPDLSIPTDADFRRRVSELTQTPEFKAEYDRYIHDQYVRSIREANALGLYSERGVLLVLDRLVYMGPLSLRRLRSAGAGPTSFSPPTELARLQQLAQASLESSPGAMRRFIERRVGMIATGRGKVGDVEYDLDALGIRYDRRLGPG